MPGGGGAGIKAGSASGGEELSVSMERLGCGMPRDDREDEGVEVETDERGC